MYLVLEGGDSAPKTVRFEGKTIRYLNPDERSTASLIRNACLKKIPQGREVVSSPGVFVSRKGFAEVVEELSASCRFVYLKEDGTDIREYQFPEDPVFVLGDCEDLTPEEERILQAKNPDRVCVGPLSLHANNCITIVNNEMDRRRGDRDGRETAHTPAQALPPLRQGIRRRGRPGALLFRGLLHAGRLRGQGETEEVRPDHRRPLGRHNSRGPPGRVPMNISAVAGTFSVLHDGHRALIAKAFEVGDEVLVGITSDAMAASVRASTVPLEIRRAALA